MAIVKPPLPTIALDNARRLRHDLTDAERKLWQRMRGAQVGGWKFRRQHPIPPSTERDAARTRFLESRGWRLVRFWDSDALLQTDAVLDAIWNILGPRTLTPTPLPVGEGLIEPKP